ncbi:Cupredoxin [Vigna unguiculata]|uniref:Cupredoxin n=1 Tax=Vigna unguiculata TaxID=3917 RepID=A0A4D6NHH6_VIGUN|nr:Cupredoxin [Vigna unguiculata]
MEEQHVVGGSQGWDASTDFKSWVSGQTFNVGDQLGDNVWPLLITWQTTSLTPFLFPLLS